MKPIKHKLEFITELDETHPTAIRLLALSELNQIAMLDSMLKELVAPIIQPTIDELNAGNSWATLKVVM